MITTIVRKSSTEIAVAPSEVWKILSDGFIDISKWAGGVKSSKLNPETPTGLNGSKYGGRVCDVDGVGETDERIVNYDADKMTLTYSVKSSGMPFFVEGLKNTWTIIPSSEGSTVEVAITATTKGIFGKVGSIPMGRMLAKAATGLPGDLKKYLEK